MAKPSLKLIDSLRNAARRIASDKENYNWKAIGACNCGNLVQEVTGYSAKEISNFGIKKHGDWQSISMLYEKDSGFEIDNIITSVLNIGLELDDFTYLENLSDPKILGRIAEDCILQRDNPDDAILYLYSWAKKLEEDLIKDISIEDLNNKKIVKSIEELVEA